MFVYLFVCPSVCLCSRLSFYCCLLFADSFFLFVRFPNCCSPRLSVRGSDSLHAVLCSYLLLCPRVLPSRANRSLAWKWAISFLAQYGNARVYRPLAQRITVLDSAKCDPSYSFRSHSEYKLKQKYMTFFLSFFGLN